MTNILGEIIQEKQQSAHIVFWSIPSHLVDMLLLSVLNNVILLCFLSITYSLFTMFADEYWQKL